MSVLSFAYFGAFLILLLSDNNFSAPTFLPSDGHPLSCLAVLDTDFPPIPNSLQEVSNSIRKQYIIKHFFIS